MKWKLGLYRRLNGTHEINVVHVFNDGYAVVWWTLDGGGKHSEIVGNTWLYDYLYVEGV